jgi:hypothetical protein
VCSVKHMAGSWQLTVGSCQRAQSVPMCIIPSVSYLAGEPGGDQGCDENHGDHSLVEGGRGATITSHLGCSLYTTFEMNCT